MCWRIEVADFLKQMDKGLAKPYVWNPMIDEQNWFKV